MADTHADALALAEVWMRLSRRVAAGAGAAVALAALLSDVNLWMASLRGGLCCVALLTVSRAARAAFLWSASGKNP